MAIEVILLVHVFLREDLLDLILLFCLGLLRGIKQI